MPALLFWLLLLLFLAAILTACSSSPSVFPAQQGTVNSNKITDTQNSTNSQQDSEQQPKTNNQDTGQIKLIPATVTEVVDGDTLHVQINGKKEKVRLIDVNTPESAHPDLGIKEEPYGEEALAYTQKRLAGRQVYLELDVGERDKYGRLLAYV
ncbi:hypothetical protein E308F_24710 [Moorella sp. E308F]|nr:hypothetical protein E308F_24710 [Moorella sp. E308F]